MIEFGSLQIENFLSIGSANVSLRSQGLVLVRGLNRDSAVAKSNGAGKSAVFEALIWALFGKTFRGISGDSVINRIRRKQCAVALSFEQDGVPYELVRFRKLRERTTGLKIFCQDKDISKPTVPETQRELEKILDFKYDTLVHSTYFGQTLAHFSSLTDAQQKKILDDLLGLAVLPRCLVKVRAVLKEISAQTIRDSTQIEVWEQEVKDGKKRVKELEQAQKKQRKELQTELDSLSKRLKHKKKQLDEQQSDLDDFEAGHEEVEKELRRRKHRHSNESIKIQRNSSKVLAQAELLTKRMKQLQKSETIFCKKIDAYCPYDEKRKKAELKELSRNENLLRRKAKHFNRLLQILGEDEKDLNKAEKSLGEQGSLIQAQQRLVTQLEGEVAAIENKLTTTQAEAQKATDLDELLDKERKRLRAKRRKREMASDRLDANKKKQKLYEFWEEGFGNAGMKSYLLDDVAGFLNSKVSEFVDYLTEGEIRIGFQTQKRLKSGETREKFAISIFDQIGQTSYAASSGGERRRIDVCILLALSELTSKNGSLPSLLILDEVFDQLDSVGMERVVRLLNSQMVGKRDSVFVITHSDVLASQFQKELLVTKENGVSSVRLSSR